MLFALCAMLVAYRYYSAFIAAKIFALDPAAPTPAHRLNDGQNYHPTKKWVLFGHHFAAIAGAGPLIGPVLAAQFGFLPGLLWIVVGVCLAGAVHDFVVLCSSVRRDGKSLAEIARTEVSPLTGAVAMVAILFVVVIALAGLGMVVVNALAESPWGTFTIAMSIPLALFMALWMYRLRPGRIAEASAIGVAGLLIAVVVGGNLEGTALGAALTLSKGQILFAMAAYGLIASVLPVWLLLCPRDYLSSYLKIGTIGALVLSVLLVNPTLHAPAISAFVAGGGPLVKGKVFPFVFITIACGAISGFHALVSSGTTPKMLDKEPEARIIGFGGMLMEGLVGVCALLCAASLEQGDYYGINAPQALAQLGLTDEHLQLMAQAVGEATLKGRTGGGVSLALGMTQIFSGLPGLAALARYAYHFCVMFEALFVLTTIDTGTRVGRFLLQELAGRVYAPAGRPDWVPGAIGASAIIVGGWTAFIQTGSVSTIWPMFGIANQLLAVIALSVGTAVILNMGHRRYAWVTLAPLLFLAGVTLTAGVESINGTFLPLAATKPMQGYLDAALTAALMLAVVIILADSARRWVRVARAQPARAQPA
ncbi:MAG: carbon starvation protein A [Deltaproteobacteria bacterium]|nr:carbon starvation protein A [Deltaproteobacteria bacterium]